MIDFDVGLVLIAKRATADNQCRYSNEKLLIMGKPVVYHNVEFFNELPFIKRIALVIDGSGNVNEIEVQKQFPRQNKILVVENGLSHIRSIQAGFHALLEEDPKVVVIHEAWRPIMPDTEWLCILIQEASRHGAAGPVVPLVSTILQPTPDGFLLDVLDRNKYGSSEMPQAFLPDVLLRAFSQCTEDDFEEGTDCLKLVHIYLNVIPKLVKGTTELQKICSHKDFYAASRMIKEKMNRVLVLAMEPMVLLLQLTETLKPNTSAMFCAADPQTQLHYSKCKSFNHAIFFPSLDDQYLLIESAQRQGWLDEKPGILIIVKQHDWDDRVEHDHMEMEDFQKVICNPNKSVIIIHRKNMSHTIRLLNLISNIILADSHAFDGQTFYI